MLFFCFDGSPACTASAWPTRRRTAVRQELKAANAVRRIARFSGVLELRVTPVIIGTTAARCCSLIRKGKSASEGATGVASRTILELKGGGEKLNCENRSDRDECLFEAELVWEASNVARRRSHTCGLYRAW